MRSTASTVSTIVTMRTVIRPYRILVALDAQDVHYFNDGGWLINRADAWSFYRKETNSAMVKEGLLEIDQPVREGNGYCVATIASEMVLRAKPFALIGCSWHVDEGPSLATGLHAARMDHSLKIPPFDEFYRLFPDDHDIITETGRLIMIEKIRNAITMPTLWESDIELITRMIATAMKYFNDPEIEGLKSDLCLELISRGKNSRGHFEKYIASN